MEDQINLDLIRESLELQCAEVELLMSMFSNPGEFVMDDPEIMEEIRAFLDGKLRYSYLQSRFGFTVKLKMEENQNHEVEVVCHLPHEYPTALPEIFTRSNCLTRDQTKKFTEDLHENIDAQERGDICIASTIQWIQENFGNYVKVDEIETQEENQKVNFDTTLSRLWVYSHHIFSKFKRKDIIEWAEELKLTGFSLPGKPGIVCVEGYSSDVETYWHRLRRLNWKRIMIKEKEDEELGDNDINTLRKFNNFEEIMLDPRGGKGREYHMDLGLFYEYLMKHDCGKIFNIYFGVEGHLGKSGSQDD